MYRVRYIPDPEPSLEPGGYPWHQLDSLRKKTWLSATARTYFDFDAGFSIVSFEVNVARNKELKTNKKDYCRHCHQKIKNEDYEIIFHAYNEGASFNDTVKEFIQTKLKRGDSIYFEEIKALRPDNRVIHLSTISIKVQ